MSLRPRLRYAALVESHLKQKEGYGRHTHPLMRVTLYSTIPYCSTGMGRPFYVDVLKIDRALKRSEYGSVDRFLRRLWRRGSVGTVKLYLKALAWFVEWSGLSPDELVKLDRERVWTTYASVSRPLYGGRHALRPPRV